MQRSPILGTRGSPLALAQAHKVASALEVANRWTADYIQIQVVETSGDKVQDRPLAEIGGKQLWTKELDRALMANEVDFCVHSLKDVEAVRPREIKIAAVRPRGDVQDRLIGAESISDLKQGAVVGTSSPRRKAQLLSIRPDLRIVPIRGNLQTRLAKLEEGEVDDAAFQCLAHDEWKGIGRAQHRQSAAADVADRCIDPGRLICLAWHRQPASQRSCGR